MNLDHIGPTNAMRRCLELQNIRDGKIPPKPKAVAPAQPAAPVATKPALTFTNCTHVVPNLKAARKFNVIPGRIREVLSRPDGIHIEVKAELAGTVALAKEMVIPCLPPPLEPKWVVALTDGRAPDDRVVRAGMIYKVINFNTARTKFLIIGEKDTQEEVGGNLVEPCHEPTIETCSKVLCVDNAEVESVLTKGKVYNVLARADDGMFIKVLFDNGKDVPAHNKRFFKPYLE